MFQSVTRNPLGSPDVIGLGAGAAAGAAAAGLLWPGVVPVPVGALIGAGIAIGAVYLGSGAGFRAPLRMVVVGIAVGAMSLAFVQLALARATREDAQVIAAYLNGSLAARSWADVVLIVVALLVLLPAALVLTRPMQLVEMGDEVAVAVGVPADRVRTWAVVVGVLLTAAAVTVSGPIAFVALTAPQIARRLTRSTGPGMVAAACCGAAVLVVADLIAQYAVPGVVYPVGVVTAALGGVYLAVLLVREWRRSAAVNGPPLEADGPDARLRPARRRHGSVGADPAGVVHRDHRARTAAASRRCCARSAARSSRARGRCCSTACPSRR